MLREFNRVLTIALLAIPTLAFAGPPSGSGYDKLVLDENVDKPIGVNGSVWNLGDWDRSFSDPRADALHQHNDKLWLNTYTENGRHRIGFVCTRGNFERKYGYIEARIKFKSRSGLNGAFWLQSIDNEVAIRREYQNQIRPFNGYGYDDLEYFGAEIDIVEALAVHKGADYKNKWVFNIHWGGYLDENRNDPMAKSYPRRSVATEHQLLRNNQNLVGEWHVFSLLWTPDYYSFYIDGEQNNFQQKVVIRQGVSRHRQYIILSLNADKHLTNWHGASPREGFGPKSNPRVGAIVDYVRWWQDDELDAAQSGVVPGPHLRSNAEVPLCRFD